MVLNGLLTLPPVFQPVDWPAFEKAGVRLTVLREDLRHPVLGGNKVWKLKYNLERAVREGRQTIVSFGGPYSNHLYAVAEVCRMSGIKFHAIVRGEEAPVNDRLRSMEIAGTQVHYISRSDYRRRGDPVFVRALLDGKGISQEALVIPEGGNNADGRKGCRELGGLIPPSARWTACAVGTGGTLSGMIEGLSESSCVLGVTVVRSGEAPEQLLDAVEAPLDRYRIIKGYEAGGYGKWNPELSAFCERFTQATGIPLEPVYTGKLFLALSDLASRGYFSRGDEVVAIHTGGLVAK